MSTIDDLNDAMLMCRTVGHSWDLFIPMMRKPQFGDRLSFLCVRCEAERHDIVSWVDGSLLSREYRHPENYHLAEKHLRNEFRLAVITRRKGSRRRKRA